MKPIGSLEFAYLAYFSRPAKDRRLFRAIRRRRVARILEIGVGQGLRSQRMIAAASRVDGPVDIRLAAIDLFEARPASAAALTLKRAHQILAPSGAEIHLLPGDPYSSLARAANSLTNTDLIVISAELDPDSLQKAWFYFPRMLHAESLVFRETGDGYQEMTRDEIEQLARQTSTRRRAA